MEDKALSSKRSHTSPGLLEIVTTVKPTYWILENVPKLNDYINLEPQIKGKISDTQYRYFWGEFPQPLLPFMNSTRVYRISGKFRSWKRAKIPTPISEAFAKAILSDNNRKEFPKKK